ncbi:hypothetical protein [Streptomyces sp. NPDC018833]|uniref:hypothetical protein n=1 Tax=Streptomyces sp. NPDC018833 TaxID=3365053 RepID=UPI00378ACD44
MAGSDVNGPTAAGYQHAMYAALALLGIGVVASLLIQRPEAEDAPVEEEPALVITHH